MVDGTVVSRSDLFGRGEDELLVDNPADIYQGFALEEVSFDTAPAKLEQHSPSSLADATDEAPAMEFQLFAGAQPMSVNLFERPQQIHQSRPAHYYFFQPSEEKKLEFKLSAVTGEFVRKEADFWAHIAAKNPMADDINRGYVPQRRKCRPGKQARLNKKARNERVEQQRMEEQRSRFTRRSTPFRPRRR